MAREFSREKYLDGIHAYAEKRIFAGDTLHVRVSSNVPYRISIFQLGADLDGTSKDVEWSSAQEGLPSRQAICPGSFVTVDKDLEDMPLTALSLECWVRPWSLSSWQGLVSQHSFPDTSGVGLFITKEGRAALYLGDGGEFDGSRMMCSPDPLDRLRWQHLVGVWDGREASLWIDGQRVLGPLPLTGPVRPGPAPLRLGAYGDFFDGVGWNSNSLDGDLAMPVIYGRALSEQEIRSRFADKGLNPPPLDGVLACWPLSEEKGSTVADCSEHQRHGQLINGGTWMIGGPSCDGRNSSRFAEGYNPAKDEQRGHALRLASDDLYDCGWETTHTFPLPEDLKPGIYVARIRYGEDFQRFYDVTFVVRRARVLPRSPLLVLCATNTWLAYSGTPFAPNHTEKDPRQIWNIYGKSESDEGKAPRKPESDEGKVPRYSFYRVHEAGQPTYRMGMNLPWPVAAPYNYYNDPYYSHLTRAERFTHLWLEQNGYDFDVATDFDLHQDPDLLRDYRVVLINGHSEYWSIPAYQGLERYLEQGGKVIALTGNTMFWRVSFDDALATMECRKDERLEKLGGMGGTIPGELYHSNDGLLGGLLRTSGYPCWRLLGLESVGYSNNGGHLAFTCDEPSHPFFEGTGLSRGDTFAQDAVGHEWDVRIDLPQQGDVSKEPSVKNHLNGIVTLAHCQSTQEPEKEELRDTLWDYDGQPLSKDALAKPQELINCQMIHWKRPAGGEVFYAGTIGAGWALSKSGADPRWGIILRNVLRHFGLQPGNAPRLA